MAPYRLILVLPQAVLLLTFYIEKRCCDWLLTLAQPCMRNSPNKDFSGKLSAYLLLSLAFCILVHSFKQRFPSVFEDFCLYSEVCLQMESCNFRATARRFLHELFLDVNLDQVCLFQSLLSLFIFFHFIFLQLYKDTEVIFKQRAYKSECSKLSVPELS